MRIDEEHAYQLSNAELVLVLINSSSRVPARNEFYDRLRDKRIDLSLLNTIPLPTESELDEILNKQENPKEECARILGVYESLRRDNASYGEFLYALLKCNWPRNDPRGIAMKTPSEIQEHLEEYMDHSETKWSQLQDNEKRLLKMYKDMYTRWWLTTQREQKSPF